MGKVKKVDIEDILENLHDIQDLLKEAIDLAEDTESLARDAGGEISRVVGGQLKGYLIPTLKAFRSSLHQTGSISSLLEFLEEIE